MTCFRSQHSLCMNKPKPDQQSLSSSIYTAGHDSKGRKRHSIHITNPPLSWSCKNAHSSNARFSILSVNSSRCKANCGTQREHLPHLNGLLFTLQNVRTNFNHLFSDHRVPEQKSNWSQPCHLRPWTCRVVFFCCQWLRSHCVLSVSCTSSQALN